VRQGPSERLPHSLLCRRGRRGEAEGLVMTLPCGDRLERTPVLMKSPSTR